MCCEAKVVQVSSLPTYKRFVALIAREKTWAFLCPFYLSAFTFQYELDV